MTSPEATQGREPKSLIQTNAEILLKVFRQALTMPSFSARVHISSRKTFAGGWTWNFNIVRDTSQGLIEDRGFYTDEPNNHILQWFRFRPNLSQTLVEVKIRSGHAEIHYSIHGLEPHTNTPAAVANVSQLIGEFKKG